MNHKRYGSISVKDEELIPLFSRPTKIYNYNTTLGMKTTSYYFCIYLLFYVIFICSGAALFSFFESPEENALKVRLNEAIENFLTAHPSVTGWLKQTFLYDYIQVFL